MKIENGKVVLEMEEAVSINEILVFAKFHARTPDLRQAIYQVGSALNDCIYNMSMPEVKKE